jgi:hypothetical protein
MLVLRLVLTAVVLAGSAAWFIERSYEWPAHQVLAPVAFLIGMLGDKVPKLVERLLARYLPDTGA